MFQRYVEVKSVSDVNYNNILGTAAKYFHKVESVERKGLLRSGSNLRCM